MSAVDLNALVSDVLRLSGDEWADLYARLGLTYDDYGPIIVGDYGFWCTEAAGYFRTMNSCCFAQLVAVLRKRAAPTSSAPVPSPVSQANRTSPL